MENREAIINYKLDRKGQKLEILASIDYRGISILTFDDYKSNFMIDLYIDLWEKSGVKKIIYNTKTIVKFWDNVYNEITRYKFDTYDTCIKQLTKDKFKIIKFIEKYDLQ